MIKKGKKFFENVKNKMVKTEGSWLMVGGFAGAVGIVLSQAFNASADVVGMLGVAAFTLEYLAWLAAVSKTKEVQKYAQGILDVLRVASEEAVKTEAESPRHYSPEEAGSTGKDTGE